MRYLAAVQHRLFQGLLLGRDEGACRSSVTLGQKHASQEFKNDASRLQALKERLAWQDEDEATDSEQTRSCLGASLLCWAVLANDLSSVREILRTTESKDIINRGLTGSNSELSVYAKTTPVVLAMGFARWDIVEVLLNAGANPFSVDTNGHDALMVAAILGMDQNIRGWLRMYPQWDLERREATVGLTALQWSVVVGGDDKANTIEALLEHGANPLTLDHAGGSVLTCAASNPDWTSHLMQRLLEFENGKLLPLLKRGASPRAMQWRLVYSVARLLARVGCCKRNKLVQELATWEGKTPLHIAGVLGHLDVCKVLVRYGAPLDALSAQGLTPLQDTKKAYGGAIPDILEAVLSLDKSASR